MMRLASSDGHRPCSQQAPHAYLIVLLYSCGNPLDETSIREEEIGRVKAALETTGRCCTALPVPHSGRIEQALEAFDRSECIVLNLFEGSGDDMEVDFALAAAALERAGFAYTGSTAQTLALDKAATKRILTQSNLPTPIYTIFDAPSTTRWNRFPAIVKPINQHGSIGISHDSVVETPERLAAQVQYVVESLHCPALVEEFIDGPEYSVSIWGNGREATVLPLIRIDYSGIRERRSRLKTFDAKWLLRESASRAIEIAVAPNLDKQLEWRIARTAHRAYAALGLRDYGRIDIRQCGEMLHILDVNSNPDIVSEGCSLVRSASCAGYGFDQVVSGLLDCTARRTSWRRST